MADGDGESVGVGAIGRERLRDRCGVIRAKEVPQRATPTSGVTSITHRAPSLVILISYNNNLQFSTHPTNTYISS
ncbi:hypothetical protein Ahy_B05g078920 isoform H [Arachis hypogaea]|uniref:Uncharacterized protein n=1 Tax=Arachis hypogaea TaxID=3818 RepID=A0A444Z8I0_ARAHY|nr:hypothetical protein Ahy_B05g078920 isoform H [Arachis hypogaea]